MTPNEKAALVADLENAAKKAKDLADKAAAKAKDFGPSIPEACTAVAASSIAVSLAALARAVAGVMRDELEDT